MEIPKRKASQEEDTVDSPEVRVQIQQLIGILQKDDRLREGFMRALGAKEAVGQPRKRRTQRLTDEQIRKTVALIGDATHDEGFLPTPPDHVTRRVQELNAETPGKGDRLLEMYYDRWEAGKGAGLDAHTQDEVELYLASIA